MSRRETGPFYGRPSLIYVCVNVCVPPPSSPHPLPANLVSHSGNQFKLPSRDSDFLCDNIQPTYSFVQLDRHSGDSPHRLIVFTFLFSLSCDSLLYLYILYINVYIYVCMHGCPHG